MNTFFIATPPPQILRSQAQGAALISASAVYRSVFTVKIFKADQCNLVYAIVSFIFSKILFNYFVKPVLLYLSGK